MKTTTISLAPSYIKKKCKTRLTQEDESLTIRLQKKLHNKRTHDPGIRSLKYSLDDLTRPLHQILKKLTMPFFLHFFTKNV